MANARVHGTTKVVPAVRFATDEQPLLQPLPARAYHSLLLGARSDHQDQTSRPRALVPGPHVDVERRSLETYATLAKLASAVGDDV